MHFKIEKEIVMSYIIDISAVSAHFFVLSIAKHIPTKHSKA